ncbi:MAG: class I SAM-dependent methyltransferase [Pseudomonadota bacterium]
MTSRTTSGLFRHIEDLQGDQPWGSFLDAGTGLHSMGWISQLSTERWTAVTGAPGDAERVRAAMQGIQRADDKIILGNWASADLLKGEAYDTVLADYLLGAVEGFAPYFQAYLLPRLRPVTRKVLYLTGVEPYVPSNRPESKAGRLVWEIGRFRDACLLLTGEMPYREYPSAWVSDQLKRARFEVRSVKRIEVRYKESFVTSQTNLDLLPLDQLPDRALADALKVRGEKLRDEALELIHTDGALVHGHKYVIAAQPV